MTHATDSLLLAYHDGEIEGPALAELRDHLASCTLCTQELDELRRMSGLLRDALTLTDVPAPAASRVRPAAAVNVPRPARRVASWGWLGTSSLAKAALLLLALTGVLAAIPGTPPRRAVELLLARLFDRAPEVMAPAPAGVPLPTVRELAVQPADGQVRVLVHGARALDVSVRLVDAAKATIETATVGPEVTLTSATGRVEIAGMDEGTLRIAIPRDARSATIEFDGEVLVRLRDRVLQLQGAAGDASGDEVSFRFTP